MGTKRYNEVNLALASAGVLFSGYLSSVKFLTTNCFVDEPCPTFLGCPACYFGLGLFVAMLIAAILAIGRKISEWSSRMALRGISAAGMLFAGYLVTLEVRQYAIAGPLGGPLGLPTCAYGLAFFTLIFAFSFKKSLGIAQAAH